MPRKSTNKKKKLQGTQRSDRVKPTVTADPVSPEPDAGLDAIAKVEWQRITTEMAEQGLITQLDAAVLAAYCTNFSRWKRAEAAVAACEGGEIIFVTTYDTHQRPVSQKPMKNPMLAVSESAQRLMSRFADQLGLSPSGRNKLGIEHQEKQEDSDEWDEFRLET